MTTEWKDLPTMSDVLCAQADGWEIEWANSSSNEFAKWSGLAWHADRQFRARPLQPRLKKAKILGYITPHGSLSPVLEGSSMHASVVISVPAWTRFPAGDIEGEVAV